MVDGMNKEDIIRMAREAGLTPEIYAHPGVKQLIAMVQASAEKYYMQLFLDPENQPTQFGTATEEYRSAEIAAEREACIEDIMWHAPRSGRDTPEYQRAIKMVERIRARVQA